MCVRTLSDKDPLIPIGLIPLFQFCVQSGTEALIPGEDPYDMQA